MKYILVDTANLFFRARHIASRNSNAWEKVGMALHLTMASTNKVVRQFNIDHVVFALDGRSWRKDFYKPYKANRVVIEADLTQAEIEESELFWETYNSLIDYLRTKTNTSVLHQEKAEADDIIARFVHLHPDDEIVIGSSDTDFDQLISDKVSRYNGITDELTTINGIFNGKGKPVIDKKTKLQKTIGDPAFVLFQKCIRGDGTDNVFSAYPGVRLTGTKDSIGIIQAFEDRNNKGYAWNNFMLQAWVDHNKVEHRVRDDYERNRTLIDLTAQPDNIKKLVDESILADLRLKPNSQVGVHFMKFCGKYDLQKLSENATTYASWLSSEYTGALNVQPAN